MSPESKNPCLEIGCFECCKNMMFLAAGDEVYRFLKALEERLGITVNYRFVDLNGLTDQLATDRDDSEYEFLIATKFKRDRRGNMVVPRLEDLKGSDKNVRLILNGNCPALEFIDNICGRVGGQCSIHGDSDRLPACGNFTYDPYSSGSACSSLRKERNKD